MCSHAKDVLSPEEEATMLDNMREQTRKALGDHFANPADLPKQRVRALYALWTRLTEEHRFCNVMLKAFESDDLGPVLKQLAKQSPTFFMELAHERFCWRWEDDVLQWRRIYDIALPAADRNAVRQYIASIVTSAKADWDTQRLFAFADTKTMTDLFTKQELLEFLRIMLDRPRDSYEDGDRSEDVIVCLMRRVKDLLESDQDRSDALMALAKKHGFDYDSLCDSARYTYCDDDEY